jgi:hypothetical protein
MSKCFCLSCLIEKLGVGKRVVKQKEPEAKQPNIDFKAKGVAKKLVEKSSKLIEIRHSLRGPTPQSRRVDARERRHR